ncbi:MAG TPA: ABC transporter ATP-binding protein [Pantanalinema sp.]
MSEIVLQAAEVTKSFKKEGLQVLRGVSLSVEKGEFIAITGPSGSGKSTLLYLLGGLDRPSSGTISIQGQSTTGMSDRRLAALRNKAIGFVFQFHFLLPELTATENVMAPLLVAGASTKEARPLAEKLLHEVELSHRLEHKPAELSGGEQQRVAIARALIQSPALLLGDELTGNLDTGTGEAIYRLLRRYNRELGQTIIVVTHNPQLAQHADRVIDMVDGRIRSVTSNS